MVEDLRHTAGLLLAAALLTTGCVPEIALPPQGPTVPLYVEAYIDNVYGTLVTVTRPGRVDEFHDPAETGFDAYEPVEDARVAICYTDGAPDDCLRVIHTGDGYYTLGAEALVADRPVRLEVERAEAELVSQPLNAPPPPVVTRTAVDTTRVPLSLLQDGVFYEDSVALTLAFEGTADVEEGYDLWLAAVRPTSDFFGTEGDALVAPSQTAPDCLIEPGAGSADVFLSAGCLERGAYAFVAGWLYPLDRGIVRATAATTGYTDYLNRRRNAQYEPGDFVAGLTEPLLLTSNLEGDGVGFVSRTTTVLTEVAPL